MGDIINAGADLLGFGPASKQADATQAAARIGAESANQATQLQREMWQAQQAQQRPFQQGGLEAQNRLMTLLGIGGQAPSSGGGGGMLGAIGGAIGNPTGGINAQGINVDPNSPDYGKYARDFSMSDFQADPGYAFRLAEGQKALDRSAAARGGLISGGALKAAQRYGQDMGSQEYTNAFNRYQTNRSNQLNPLQSLMGVGQTATNQLAAAGQNYANTAGNIGMLGGANQANALMTGGNIRASQYGTAGRAIDQLYNYGSKNNWFGGGSSPTGTEMSQQDYAIASGGY